jgi:aminoglycoside phosphotransferase (APT) family kinase protein
MGKMDDILMEPEFKQGGFVWKHIENNSPDPLRSVQSAVDRMRELHDIDDREFDLLCQNLLTKLQFLVGRS